MTRTTSLLAALAIAFGSTTALAQTTGGSPADPNTNQNQQPGPSVDNPADPAAGSDPAARVPTSPPGTGESAPATEGMGTGDSGRPEPGRRYAQRPLLDPIRRTAPRTTCLPSVPLPSWVVPLPAWGGEEGIPGQPSGIPTSA
jgi:hypothetical protein